MIKSITMFVIIISLLFPFCLFASPLSVNAAPTIYTDDGSSSVIYTGVWSVEYTNQPGGYYYADDPWGAYNNSFHISGTTNSTVSYTFTGNSISLISTLGDNMGKAEVTIDGGQPQVIDLYIPAYEHEPTKNIKHKRAIFIKNGLSDGQHTISIRVLGQKHPDSSGYNVTIDCFEIRTSNRAKNTIVTASSSVEGWGWHKTKLVDGERNSVSGAMGWSSNDNLTQNHTEWVQIDLGDNNYIDRIDIYPRNDGTNVGEYFPIDFIIQVSKDNSVWTTVVSKTGYPKPGNEVQSFRIAAQTVRYIKIIGTNLRQCPTEYNYYRMQFAEVEAYYDEYKHTGSMPAQPGTTYYISSSSGSDSNNGTSPSTPWKTLAKASTMIYSGGNQILLKCGDTWNDETLFLHGNGTSGNPIIVSSYGTGNKPVINAGKGAAYGIQLVDSHGYKFTNLEFTGSVGGIHVLSDVTFNHDYLWIENCYFHDIEGTSIDTDVIMPYPGAYYGAGIMFSGFSDPDNRGKTLFSNITIKDCNFYQCDTGIINLIRDKPMDLNGSPTNAWYFERDAYTNFNIINCTIRRSYRSGGIMLYGVTGGMIDNVLIDETGYQKGMWWGTAACQVTMSENYTVKNSEFKNTYRTNNSPDGEGFDFESGNKNIMLLNCYIHDNEGPAILFYGGNGGWRLNNDNNIVDGCFLYNNGTYGAGYDSKALKNYPNNTGIVKNCIFKLKFVGQECSAAPMMFDTSNYIVNPDWSQVYGPGRTNHALGSTVTASSDVNGWGWHKSYVCDGITSNLAAPNNIGWSSNDSLETNHTEWIKVDMGSVKTISEVDLYACDRDTVYFPEDFTIEVSTDNVNWTTVVTRTNYPQPSASAPKQVFSFSPCQARYVKVTGTSLRSNPNEYNYYRMQIAEIAILQLY